jgi:hypothetical protein
LKYNIDQNLNDDRQKEIFLQAIANEIAEQNRLTRISLTNSFMQAATSQLYKQGKNEKGEAIILAPTEEDQAKYDQLVAGIEFTLSDHLGKIDEEKLKEMQAQAEAEAEPEKKENEN